MEPGDYTQDGESANEVRDLDLILLRPVLGVLCTLIAIKPNQLQRNAGSGTAVLDSTYSNNCIKTNKA
jgi:hypothetical protein